ncbi:MAG: hypothetical protein Q9172_003897 [Xanthocarpia lactea]
MSHIHWNPFSGHSETLSRVLAMKYIEVNVNMIKDFHRIDPRCLMAEPHLPSRECVGKFFNSTNGFPDPDLRLPADFGSLARSTINLCEMFRAQSTHETDHAYASTVEKKMQDILVCVEYPMSAEEDVISEVDEAGRYQEEHVTGSTAIDARPQPLRGSDALRRSRPRSQDAFSREARVRRKRKTQDHQQALRARAAREARQVTIQVLDPVTRYEIRGMTQEDAKARVEWDLLDQEITARVDYCRIMGRQIHVHTVDIEEAEHLKTAQWEPRLFGKGAYVASDRQFEEFDELFSKNHPAEQTP